MVVSLPADIMQLLAVLIEVSCFNSACAHEILGSSDNDYEH
jgi:hypothetical protein